MTLLTISLLISDMVGIVIVLLGVMLWMGMKTINHNIRAEGRATRMRIGEVKTRLHDQRDRSHHS